LIGDFYLSHFKQERIPKMKKYTLLLIFILILTTSCQYASEPTLVPTSEPTLALPFSALEPYWSEWVKTSASGPYEVYCESSGNSVEYGVHFEAGQGMSFDSWGNPVPPTNDGGLITFRTDNCTYEWVNGIKVQASTRLTLRVSKDTGLVYQEGSGKIVLPNGDTLVFGSGTPVP
jgi:hypothetical protein